MISSDPAPYPPAYCDGPPEAAGATHGIGLARSRLSIGKDCSVEPLEERCGGGENRARKRPVHEAQKQKKRRDQKRVDFIHDRRGFDRASAV